MFVIYNLEKGSLLVTFSSSGFKISTSKAVIVSFAFALAASVLEVFFPNEFLFVFGLGFSFTAKLAGAVDSQAAKEENDPHYG